MNSLSMNRVICELGKVTALIMVLVKRRKKRLHMKQSSHKELSILNDISQEIESAKSSINSKADFQSKKPINELLVPVKGKEKVPSKHCFIEELYRNEDKQFSQFKGVKFEKVNCPLTNNESCYDSGEIVAIYQQICDDIQEKISDLQEYYEDNSQENMFDKFLERKDTMKMQKSHDDIKRSNTELSYKQKKLSNFCVSNTVMPLKWCNQGLNPF